MNNLLDITPPVQPKKRKQCAAIFGQCLIENFGRSFPAVLKYVKTAALVQGQVLPTTCAAPQKPATVQAALKTA
ncbi:MAG: hypothetical protein J6I73_05925 [Treponema sp.]|nr:hypothetical protein [Treponema sp.]